MGMIPYDVRSTVSRYSSCSEHSTTIHAFRSATNEGVSSRPMNDIRVLNLKQTKMTYFPKHRVLQKKYRFEEAVLESSSSRSWRVSIYSSAEKDEGLHQPSSSRIFMAERDVFYGMITCSFMTMLVFSLNDSERNSWYPPRLLPGRGRTKP